MKKYKKNIMIKIATKEDAKLLAKMSSSIWHDSIDELTKTFLELIVSTKDIVLILTENEMPIGFANATIRYDYVEGTSSSPVGYLEGIYIESSFRKQGYGRLLVVHCEKWAKEKGCTEFASDCELDNKESYAFHLALGFTEENRIICFKKEI